MTRADPIAALRALGLDSDTLAVDSGGTIVGPALPPTASGDITNWPLPVDAKHELLGRGGMGEVHAASQRGLEREVAIKTVIAGGDPAQLHAALLREAWATGQLEHPNVVPVHAIGGDADGRLAIVMKRIRGQPWSELLEAEDEDPRFEGADPLELHLQILEQVCQATHFAHSRGILHRDIKPENVMLGEHGEVYLVDWGLAVTLPGAPKGPLVDAASIDTIQGTPGYLAPEMLRPAGTALNEATDVFLLGACLHRVLTGEERWAGKSVMQKLARAVEFEPYDYGSELPTELAAIATRAMQMRARDRYPSADALRRALANYRAHAAALRVTERALARLAELGTELDTNEPDRVRIAELAAESRFGLQLAVEQWAEGPAALAGLSELSQRMVARELANENPDAADEWLRLSPNPPSKARERIAQLRAELEARHAAARRDLERERDPRVGARSRFLVAALAALAAPALGIGAIAWTRVTGEAPGHGPFIALFGANAVWGLWSVLRAWRRIPQAARVQAVLTVYGWTSLACVSIAGAAFGFAIAQTAVLIFVTAALTWAALAGLASPRMWLACGIFLFAALLTLVFPQQIWLIVALSGASGMSAVAWAWSSRERSRE